MTWLTCNVVKPRARGPAHASLRAPPTEGPKSRLAGKRVRRRVLLDFYSDDSVTFRGGYINK